MMPKFFAQIKRKISNSQIKETYTVSFKLAKLAWKIDSKLFLLNVIVTLLPAITPFITAYLFKLIIDFVVSSIAKGIVDYQHLLLLISIVVLMGYINSISFSIQNYTNRMLWTKLPITINQIVLNKIASLDLYYFEDSSFKDMLQKVRDGHDWRTTQLMYYLLFTMQSIVQVTIALIAIVKLNVYLMMILVILAIPDLYSQLHFSRIAWGIWGEHTPLQKKYYYLTNLIQRGDSIKELKIFQTTQFFLKELKDTQISFFNKSKEATTKKLKFDFMFNFVDTILNFSIMFYVIFLALKRSITVGDISFYQSIISNFNNGLGGLFRNLSNVFEHSLYVKSVFEVLELQPIITSPTHPKIVDFKKTPTIEFRNVSFSYPGSKKKILDGVNLFIDHGQKIAFVGENGAGKTTLIKLLARFYDATEGEILIDGINIKELDLVSWYKTLGVLFQDFIKYEYPVKENIYFGKAWEKEKLEEITSAAFAAGAHDMIKGLDKKYDQMLGRTFEGGIELSGGQWQKIALSRAFFRNAPILILDEPTANIDAKAESEIFSRVEKLSKDKSVIIISHRFSTVRNADQIYVIDHGKIVESGSHKELMQENGRYAKLFSLQAKGYQ